MPISRYKIYMELSRFNSYRSKRYRSWNRKLNSKYNIFIHHTLHQNFIVQNSTQKRFIWNCLVSILINRRDIDRGIENWTRNISMSIIRLLHQNFIVQNSTRKRFIGNCLVSILIDRKDRIVESKIELKIYLSTTRPLHQNLIVQNSTRKRFIGNYLVSFNSYRSKG